MKKYTIIKLIIIIIIPITYAQVEEKVVKKEDEAFGELPILITPKFDNLCTSWLGIDI